MSALTLRLFGNGILATALNGIFGSLKATIAFFICIVLILAAIFAPWIAPQNPYDLMQIDFFDSKLPPMSESMNGMVYLLGTDTQGRDMLSAMLYGLRTSLGVGLTAGLLALVVGSALGLLAAYAGGRIDALIMRVLT